MADPLSTIASVIGVAAAVVQSAKILFGLVDDIKNAPEEIAALSRDAHAFCSIVFSLQLSLSEDEIQNVVGQDRTMTQMVENLRSPLANCQKVLGQLMVKIQGGLKRTDEGTGWRMSSININWGLFTKGEIKDLMVRLEATKSTLDNALNSICTCVIALPINASRNH